MITNHHPSFLLAVSTATLIFFYSLLHLCRHQLQHFLGLVHLLEVPLEVPLAALVVIAEEEAEELGVVEALLAVHPLQERTLQAILAEVF